jgi:Epoxyqueuosine reductase QueH
MRMEVTAAYASTHGYHYFTTTNATSRWKDEIQVNIAGIRAAHLYSDRGSVSDGIAPQFWVYDWKTDDMTRRKYEVSVSEKFYKQEYCGCSYSLRDSNVWRAQQGIPPVVIGGETAGLGTRYFEDAVADAAEESQEVVDSFFKDANAHFGDCERVERRDIKVLGVAKNSGSKVVGVDFDKRLKSADSSSSGLNNW